MVLGAVQCFVSGLTTVLPCTTLACVDTAYKQDRIDTSWVLLAPLHSFQVALFLSGTAVLVGVHFWKFLSLLSVFETTDICLN
jgi:hypothetical protein